LNMNTSSAFWNKSAVPLSVRDVKLLHHLATHAGEDVRYRGLGDLVQVEGFVAGYADDGYRINGGTVIKDGREKFSDLDDGFDAIENYPGFGYRWRDDSIGEA